VERDLIVVFARLLEIDLFSVVDKDRHGALRGS
jgi:hypothetical protein